MGKKGKRSAESLAKFRATIAARRAAALGPPNKLEHPHTISIPLGAESGDRRRIVLTAGDVTIVVMREA